MELDRSAMQYERAFRAWPVLTAVASRGETLTYKELGDELGIHHRAVQYVLGVIQDYCLNQALPPLTIVSSTSTSGFPARGLSPTTSAGSMRAAAMSVRIDGMRSQIRSRSQPTEPIPPSWPTGSLPRGNLLRDGHRAVLADWDTVSTGPRETDLIPTLQAARFGLPAAQRDAFITAYGYDIRTWDAYQVLRDIRELSTLSALLRDGSVRPAARHELQVRLRSLRSGDDAQWAAF